MKVCTLEWKPPNKTYPYLQISVATLEVLSHSTEMRHDLTEFKIYLRLFQAP